MNNATAQKLFAEGAIFLFLDVPKGTEFGIDMKSWNTGDLFRGVKMIPAGMHYIFYSSVGKMGETAPRIGFFHNFRKGELVVRRWDKESEEMSSQWVEEQIIDSLKENIQALDKFLGPYPFDVYDKWSSLSEHITEFTINHLSPVSGKIRSALDLVSINNEDRIRGDTQKSSDEEPCCSSSTTINKTRHSLTVEDQENKLLPDLVPVEGTELRFTVIPDERYPDGSSGAQITQHCMDSSYTLELMFKKYNQPLDLIGEMEFSYICFLVGHSLEAFENWKKLVSLVCSCEKAIVRFRNIYDALIEVLEVQLKEIPEEFLADIVTNNNFIYVKLRCLFRAIAESEVDGRLKTKTERFRDKLSQNYCWDFTHLASDDEDDAPVIVEF